MKNFMVFLKLISVMPTKCGRTRTPVMWQIVSLLMLATAVVTFRFAYISEIDKFH